MITNRAPSKLRIIQIDRWAFMAAVFLVIFWVIYICNILAGKNIDTSFMYLTLAATFISVVVLIWRIPMTVLLTAVRIFLAFPRAFFRSDQDWEELNHLIDVQVQEAI